VPLFNVLGFGLLLLLNERHNLESWAQFDSHSLEVVVTEHQKGLEVDLLRFEHLNKFSEVVKGEQLGELPGFVTAATVPRRGLDLPHRGDVELLTCLGLEGEISKRNVKRENSSILPLSLQLPRYPNELGLSGLKYRGIKTPKKI